MSITSVYSNYSLNVCLVIALELKRNKNEKKTDNPYLLVSNHVAPFANMV